MKFELNKKGVSELMKSEEMMNILDSYGQRVMDSVGKGYEKSSMAGKNRANVTVAATSSKAMKDNAKHNTLLKALGSARGGS